MMKRSEVSKSVIPLYLYLLISFIEGGSVMTVELVGAKLVAPFFGNSLYVWASVLGVTLGGLALGYFLGGWFSKKYPNEKLLFIVLFLASVTVLWMAPLGTTVMGWLLSLSIIPATLISCFIFLFPPLLCFGMSSPIIIDRITEKGADAGRSSGMVYAVSTIGGIMMTFLTGFYLIPWFGLSRTLMVVGSILFLVPCGYFISRKVAVSGMVVLLGGWILFFIMGMRSQDYPIEKDGYRVQYRSEGLLGQLMVVDKLNKNGEPRVRGMYVNYSAQTYMDLSTGHSVWPYVPQTSALVAPNALDEDDRVLLCGLGGGLLANKLFQVGFEEVEVVDLDHRMEELALEYFGLDPRTEVFIDDARHFIRTAERKYDAVVFDLTIAERPPTNIYTVESFRSVKEHLTTEGALVIHYNNRSTGLGKKAICSIGTTLEDAGFEVRLFDTRTPVEKFGDRIFYAKKKGGRGINEERSYEGSSYFRDKPFYSKASELFIDSVSFSQGVLLTDDKPRVDILESNSRTFLRKAVIEHTISKFKRKDIPILE